MCQKQPLNILRLLRFRLMLRVRSCCFCMRWLRCIALATLWKMKVGSVKGGREYHYQNPLKFSSHQRNLVHKSQTF